MKLKLTTLTALGVLALGGTVLANDPATPGDNRPARGGGGRHNPFERMMQDLNLTPEQRTKIQPIVDQAQPQLEAIRREAIEKTKTVMENASSQIRPLLTAEQQKKLDEAKNDRMHGERKHRHHGQGDDDGGDQ